MPPDSLIRERRTMKTKKQLDAKIATVVKLIVEIFTNAGHEVPSEKLRNWEVMLDDRPNSSDEVYLWIDEKGFRKTAKDSEYEELKSLWVTLCDQYKNP